MTCLTVHQFGGWYGLVLNNRRRIIYTTDARETEFAARQAANLWMLSKQGRAA